MKRSTWVWLLALSWCNLVCAAELDPAFVERVRSAFQWPGDVEFETESRSTWARADLLKNNGGHPTYLLHHQYRIVADKGRRSHTIERGSYPITALDAKVDLNKLGRSEVWRPGDGTLYSMTYMIGEETVELARMRSDPPLDSIRSSFDPLLLAPASGDAMPIWEVWRDADEVRIDSEQSEVDGLKVVTVVSRGKRGYQEVSFASERGYLPIKGRAIKRTGDLSNSRKIGDPLMMRGKLTKKDPDTSVSESTFAVTGFQELNGRWVATSCKRTSQTTMTDGTIAELSGTLEVKSIKLLHNPPPELFAPKIPEGTVIHVEDQENAAPRIWKEGKPRIVEDEKVRERK